MSTASLRMFVITVIGNRRIRFGDLRRLQREVLPGGITSRDEAEILLALDDAVPRADRAWTDYLVDAVAEFVVWTEDPTGTVAEGTAEWLLDVLSSGCRSKAAIAIARRVGRETTEGLAALPLAPSPVAFPGS